MILAKESLPQKEDLGTARKTQPQTVRLDCGPRDAKPPKNDENKQMVDGCDKSKPVAPDPGEQLHKRRKRSNGSRRELSQAEQRGRFPGDRCPWYWPL